MSSNNLATKSDIKKLESDIKKLDGRILDSEVKILGELKGMREEFSTHSFSHVRLDEEVEDLQKRVTKLESTHAWQNMGYQI